MMMNIVASREEIAIKRSAFLSKSRADGKTESTPEERKAATKVSALAVKARNRDGCRIINDYVLLGKLGRGSYSTVFKASHLAHDKQYAIKVVSRALLRRGYQRKNNKKKVDTVGALLREAAVMKKLFHPNVVTLFEVIDDPAAEKVYLVQELCELGPVLADGAIGDDVALAEDVARKYFRDICKGLLLKKG
jgi:serine/threonine protein kinase